MDVRQDSAIVDEEKWCLVRSYKPSVNIPAYRGHEIPHTIADEHVGKRCRHDPIRLMIRSDRVCAWTSFSWLCLYTVQTDSDPSRLYPTDFVRRIRYDPVQLSAGHVPRSYCRTQPQQECTLCKVRLMFSGRCARQPKADYVYSIRRQQYCYKKPVRY